MELEHQHKWRLPNTDSDTYGFADTSYPNSNTDSHTDTNSHA
jgi:hypothetical protein